MPLWVDLKGVPNNLYSRRGLKCLSRAVGRFVKLHPHTEKCVRLDVARALIEVDLHTPLVEKISYLDGAGAKQEVEVTFPWLPSRCNICHRWGHKGQECTGKGVTLKRRSNEDKETSTFQPMPQEVDKIVETEENVLQNLIQDLEATIPRTSPSNPTKGGELGVSVGVPLSEPTTEGFQTSDTGNWETIHGKKQVREAGEKDGRHGDSSLSFPL